MKVIASSIRKGNVIEQDGKLYVVLTAENIHPGKGTPVSQIEMRRISDGVKISERYKTTDQVEKATIEGVVRAPSSFAMTLGSPPSRTATQELVVPRSIPMIFAILRFTCLRSSSSVLF